MFVNNPPSFYWGTLCIMVMLTVLETITHFLLLGYPLILCFIYVWSKYEPEALVSIFGGFQVKGAQLPFVYMGLTMLMGGSIYTNLVSLVVGEVFYLLKEKVPQDYGLDLVAPPQFFSKLFDRRPNQPNVRFAGRGQRLG
jgi:Der1-like family